MADAVEAGAGLAWRLLATLEGGSLLVATSALIAYTARLKLCKKRRYRIINSVLVSNTSSRIGRELKSKLEAHGYTVRVPSEGNTACLDKVDALVVIGAEFEPGLEGISQLVTQDVYDNLKLLETLSYSVKRGGCITWACSRGSGGAGAARDAGGTDTAYAAASSAFDAVLRASLQYIARISHCDGVWIDRCATTEQTVDRIIDEFSSTTPQDSIFSLRNTAHNVSTFFGRWLKMIT
ncbi:unnamed protein product, partial [Brenthis ino]